MENLVRRAAIVTNSAYGGRDVVNAPAVKRAIARRSQDRNDPPEIADWLANHFFRHAIGNFTATPPDLKIIATLDEARALFHPGAVPEWVAACLKRRTDAPATDIWWLEPASPALLAVEARLVEFLHARLGGGLAGKLARINCPQALALSAAEHAAFAARSAAGWREHQPSAVCERLTTPQGMFVEFVPDSPLLRAEMAYESQMMRHCLGQFAQRRALSGGYGERYAAECAAGRLRLFSFRTSQHQPHITISAELAPDGRWRVDQIKGKQNRPPVAKYREEVRDFLNTLDTDDSTPEDAVAIGLLRTQGGWRAAADIGDAREQVDIVHRHPALIRELPRPTPLAQWLVAAHQPEYLEGIAVLPAVTQALNRARA